MRPLHDMHEPARNAMSCALCLYNYVYITTLHKIGLSCVFPGMVALVSLLLVNHVAASFDEANYLGIGHGTGSG